MFIIFKQFICRFSYHVYIDENGDAAGNYTVLARGYTRNHKNKTVPGLIPVGTFSQTQSDKLPVSIKSIKDSLPKFRRNSSKKLLKNVPKTI